MSEWISKKIKDFASTTSGGTPSTSIKEYWEDGTIPWINSGELSQNNFITQPTTYISEKALQNSSAKLMPKGTVVIALTGATTGMSALLEIETSGNQSITGIFPSEKHDSKFLLYLLQKYRNKILGFNTGSAQPHINKQIVDDLEFLFPEKVEEQTRIAEILSTADASIAETERLIAKYNRIKTGLMQDLLTRGIDENGNIRSKSTHKFVIKNGIEVPEDWDVVKLSEIGKASDYLKTGPFGSSLKISDWVNVGIPVVTIGSIGESTINPKQLLYVNQEKADSLSAYQLLEGDILFSRVADVGRSIVILKKQSGWIMSSNFMRLRINKNDMLPSFLQINLKANNVVKAQIRQNSNSGGRDLVNSEVLNSLYFPKPEITEQSRIIENLKSINKHIEEKTIIIRKLNSLKTGLMQDLLSGNKRVV